MSDETSPKEQLNDLAEEAEEIDPAEWLQFGPDGLQEANLPRPQTDDEKIAKTEAEKEREREAKSIRGVRQIARHNEDRLERIYKQSGFHPEDPPDDFKKFREELARLRLVGAVHAAVGGTYRIKTVPDERNGEFIPLREEKKPGEVAVQSEQSVDQSDEDIARKAVEILSTYGEEAESELSHLAESGDIPNDIRLLALENLKTIRQGSKTPSSLYEAIINRISSGGCSHE